ncbi:tRNA synthetases class I, catalytic domain-containing protein [Gongronella butleri]|nr:tRNA synthetases class I, catalytic domain-containing protein [Gongronella butleri]
MLTLTAAIKASPVGLLALAEAVNSTKPGAIQVDLKDDKVVDGGAAAQVVFEGVKYEKTNAIARLIGRLNPETGLYDAQCPITSTLIDQWVDFAEVKLLTNDFKAQSEAFKVLNKHLTLRSFIVGYSLSIADFAIFGALKSSAAFNRTYKSKKESLGSYLVRWFDYIQSLDASQKAAAALQVTQKKQDKGAAKNKASDQGKFDIGLTEAEMGKVVTRFPPEPSGYLHIGHAKAALLNQYFAETYKGKMIIRFDDTNPSKEKMEFEESIKEDLKLIGVESNIVTHSSDYFDKMYELAIQIIKDGKAYVDDTDQLTMRDERMKCIASKSRDLPVEENLRRFEEMKNATEFGQSCCLRAKISVDDPNGTMRDPVIYRCNLTPHHYTGDKWKIYPTYDFACPIVDSIEGVTHALRTNEYRDRNAQYQWMLEALGLRKVTIWDFSRINFVYTLLSKRKLQWFVDNGFVGGWDDPRFPTVRGIRRRGMTIEALKQYILMQGASQNTLLLEWDKLWALNKKVIDPVAPRHTAVFAKGKVVCNVQGIAAKESKQMPKHKKNPDAGNKTTNYSPKVLMDQEDAKSLEVGEEVTLMDWGNAFVRNVTKDGETVSAVDLELHLEGDFKKTKKKLTWLSFDDDVVPVTLVDYDYLITKKKVEEGDEVKDLVTPVTEYKEDALADGNVKDIKHGDIIQFERKGYYICDAVATADSPALFIAIPDGKTASTASKHK